MGIQFINITDPYNHSLASTIKNGDDGYDILSNTRGITTVTVGNSIYALIGLYDGNGVQFINITDPYNPLPASSIIDEKDGYTRLDSIVDVTTVIIDGLNYALVLSYFEDLQIVRLEQPLLTSNNPNPSYAKTGDTLTLDICRRDWFNNVHPVKLHKILDANLNSRHKHKRL